MPSKYFPPVFNTAKFHCIRCGVLSQQHWYQCRIPTTPTPLLPVHVSICAHCEGKTYWHEERIILPDASPAELPHDDMPIACRADYEEARSIFTRSPRASAALLRLCVQKLMKEIGEKGDNINKDIKSLTAKGLPILVQQSLDICRVVGNNAVHPGEINVSDSPEIAQRLFGLINFIVEDRIARPRQIAELYAQLPESDRAAIEKRDNPTS